MRLGGPRGSRFATFRRGSSAKSRRCTEQLLGRPLDATLATEIIGTELAANSRSAQLFDVKHDNILTRAGLSSPNISHSSD